MFGTMQGEPFKNTTITSVLLHYATPEFSKEAFPESGADADHRAGVVNKSVIDYKLGVKNPDDYVSINNVVVQDVLDPRLSINNMPQVQIDNGEPADINKAPIISSYEVEESGGIWTFTATISSIAKGETITLIVPATVNAALDAPIDNTATITSFNGIDADIRSETTYHYVTVTQAKIKKVDSKRDGLEGAKLEVYENNSTNWDSANGKIKSGATPKTVHIDNSDVTQFTSSTDVITFDLEPGDYILHEAAVPENSGYNLAADIPFTIDIEGITHVDGKTVNFVEMVDEPAYKIIFHENKPDGTIEERNKEFRIYEPKDLVENEVTHFYDIPEWAGDEYVFAGWYCSNKTSSSNKYRIYSRSADIDSNVNTAADFESDTFTAPNNATYTGKDGNYHLYAKWIPVGTVQQQKTGENIDTNNYGDTPIRGFGLAGVQIRDPKMFDSNYNQNNTDPNDVTPSGLRFVTSLKESLLSDIDVLSSQKVNTAEGDVDVEYGYAVATEDNIKTFTGESGYNVADPAKYKLQHKGRNVNGVDTTGTNAAGERFDPSSGHLLDELQESLNADNDYAYVTNVNCTRGTTNSMGTIKDDHRNLTAYRLYTLVVTYEGSDSANKDKKIDARAYIRYYDANGKLRVFYNNYNGNRYYGGCMCSLNQVLTMALPKSE